MRRAGRRLRALVLGASIALGALAAPAGAQDVTTTTAPTPTTVAATGAVPNPEVVGPIPATNGLRKRMLTTPLDSLAEHGYVEEELFVSGRAGEHAAAGEWGRDGEWATTTEDTDAYRTRLLVRRPADPARFNGTVVVSWLDVTGAFDGDEDWNAVGEEIMREGAAYVAVSAQMLGVNGPLGAVVWDATRYGALRLFSDALSYDVFSQAGQAIKQPQGVDPLAGLPGERRLIATGRSQAAQRLVTYINAFHPDAQVYDGFLLQSRFPNAAPLGNAEVARSGLSLTGVLDPRLDALPDPLPTLLDGPARAVIREDVDVPVLLVQTETDVARARGAGQEDSGNLRTWEVAGGSHLDQSVLGGLVGLLTRDFPGIADDQLSECPSPNAFPTEQAVRGALHALSAWVDGGDAPEAAPRLEVDDEGTIERDEDGNAQGGVRLPALAVPTAVHTGESDGDQFCALAGSTAPFSADALLERYPSHQAYVAAVTRAADAAVDLGHLVPEDAAAIVAAATSSGIGGTATAAEAAEAAASSGSATASPEGAAAPERPEGEASASAPAAPEAAAAEPSNRGWMATTGWNLIAPLLGGVLLLLNGRVVLTIANQRRSGSGRGRAD